MFNCKIKQKFLSLPALQKIIQKNKFKDTTGTKKNDKVQSLQRWGDIFHLWNQFSFCAKLGVQLLHDRLLNLMKGPEKFSYHNALDSTIIFPPHCGLEFTAECRRPASCKLRVGLRVEEKLLRFLMGIFLKARNEGIYFSRDLFFTLNYSLGPFISSPIKSKILPTLSHFGDLLSVLMNHIPSHR